MSEQHKSATSSATQKKEQWKVISTEEKSDIINQLEMDECIANICCTIHTICEAERIVSNISQKYMQVVYNSFLIYIC
jgi:hypothetical protein